jgi:hypothetical protein
LQSGHADPTHSIEDLAHVIVQEVVVILASVFFKDSSIGFVTRNDLRGAMSEDYAGTRRGIGNREQENSNDLSTVVEDKFAFLDRNEGLEPKAPISSPKYGITWAPICTDGAPAHVQWQIGAPVGTWAMFRRAEILH